MVITARMGLKITNCRTNRLHILTNCPSTCKSHRFTAEQRVQHTMLYCTLMWRQTATIMHIGAVTAEEIGHNDRSDTNRQTQSSDVQGMLP